MGFDHMRIGALLIPCSDSSGGNCASLSIILLLFVAREYLIHGVDTLSFTIVAISDPTDPTDTPNTGWSVPSEPPPPVVSLSIRRAGKNHGGEFLRVPLAASATAVPAPETLASLGAGIFAMGLARNRRRLLARQFPGSCIDNAKAHFFNRSK